MAYKLLLPDQRKIGTSIDKHCHDLMTNYQKETGIMFSWILSRALECYFEKLGRYTPTKTKDSND